MTTEMSPLIRQLLERIYAAKAALRKDDPVDAEIELSHVDSVVEQWLYDRPELFADLKGTPTTMPTPSAIKIAQAILDNGIARVPDIAQIIDRESLQECAQTIKFLMSQIEQLAGRAFANHEDTEQWLDKNDAMNAGKRTLAKLNHKPL